jgi:hypothetical protein
VGYYINTYCPGAVGIEGYYEQASDGTLMGPLMIGERHDKPHARAIIGDLILAGEVSRLFVEIQKMDLDSQLRGDQYLGKPVEELQQDKSLNTLSLILNAFDRRFQNPLTLSMIILAAVNKGVMVYFYDSEHATPTTRSGMHHRNRAMASVFSSEAGYGSVGLVGGDHLKGDPKGTNKKYSLQAKCTGMKAVILNLLDVWK